MTRERDARVTHRGAYDLPTTRLGYTARELSVGGLMQYRSRYYDPGQGRFLQQDAYRGADVMPPSLHRYTYTHNSPINYTDPTGFAVPALVLIALMALLFVAIGSINRSYRMPGESYLACTTRFMQPLVSFFTWVTDIALVIIASFAVRVLMLLYFLFMVLDDMMAEMILSAGATPTAQLVLARLGQWAMVALVKPIYYVIAFTAGWYLVGAIRYSMPTST